MDFFVLFLFSMLKLSVTVETHTHTHVHIHTVTMFSPIGMPDFFLQKKKKNIPVFSHSLSVFLLAPYFSVLFHFHTSNLISGFFFQYGSTLYYTLLLSVLVCLCALYIFPIRFFCIHWN